MREKSLRVAVVAGVIAAFATAAYIFAPGIDAAAVAVSVTHGLAVGVGAWAFSLGRACGRRGLALLGAAVMVATLAVTRLTFLNALLDPIGAGPDRPFGWRWVNLGGSSITGLAAVGMVLAAVLAVPAGLGAWRLRHAGTVRRRAVNPWLASGGAAAAALWLAVGTGSDPGFLPFLVIYALIVGLGAYAIAAGAARHRGSLWTAGWLTVGGVPVMHALGRLTPVDSWAPTMLHDLVGVVITLSSAIAAGVILLTDRHSAGPPRRLHRRRVRPAGSAGGAELRVLTAVLAGAVGLVVLLWPAPYAPEGGVPLPAVHYLESWIVGLLWLAAAALLLKPPSLEWVQPAVLLSAGLVIPVTVLVSPHDEWYWGGPYQAVATGAVVAAGIGCGGLASRRRPTSVRVVGIIVVVLAGVCLLMALAMGASVAGYLDTDVPYSYSGDYLVLAFHLMAMGLAVMLAALGGWLVGRPPRPPRPNAPIDPPPARPRRSRAMVSLVVLTLAAAACGSTGGSGSQRPTASDPSASGPTTSTSTVAPATTTTTTVPVVTTTTSLAPVPPVAVEGLPDHLRYGEFGLWRFTAGEAELLSDEPVLWAADDLMGGVLFAAHSLTGEQAIFWRAEGKRHHWRLDDVEEPIAVVALDGRPTLVYAHHDVSDESSVFLGRLDLATGDRSVSDNALVSAVDDLGPRPRSVGGALVGGVDSAAVGFGGTDRTFVFWDIEGVEQRVAANPHPESCEPCSLSLRLAPDGTSMAYYHRPDAPWPPDVIDQLGYDGWWERSQRVTGSVVVIDVATGDEGFRAEAAPRSRVVDYDGRFVVLLEFLGDEAGLVSTVYDTISDTSAAVGTMTVPGVVKLLRSRIGWPAVPGCSAAGLEPSAASVDVPPAVESTRAAIVGAATACNLDRLSQLAAVSRQGFAFGYGDTPSPAFLWADLERQGEPILRRLTAILATPHAVIERADGDVYVWPSLDQDTDLSTEDWAVLAGVYSAAEIAELQRYADSGYVGIRVGIRDDGVWQFAIAGD